MNDIVVGVDGSPGSELALAWAIEYAGARKLPVTAVTAWSISGPLAGAGLEWEPAPARDTFEQHAKDLVEEQVRKALSARPEGAPEVRVAARAMPGPAAHVLLSAAQGADHLVVGSRGVGGFARLLLGSTSSQVVHHAGCPVTVVPSPHTEGGLRH